MSKLFDGYFDFFDVESWAGLARLILFALAAMIGLRLLINPVPVDFPSEIASNGDYRSMIVMGALLIALDAMLLVVLNFRRLGDWRDALILATCVGLTHVFFPLFTFAIAAGAYFPFRSGLLPPEMVWLAIGTVSAIYFIAAHFVLHHVREVFEGLFDHEVDGAPSNLRSWDGLKAAWPTIFGVSIDALIVGPAKVGFMDRYDTMEFLLSFVWIGLGVFALVLLSGLMVILLTSSFKGNDVKTTGFVKSFDFWNYQLLIIVFLHFTSFAGLYLLYTFVPDTRLLETWTIWGLTGIAAIGFLVWLDRAKLREAVAARAVAVQIEES